MVSWVKSACHPAAERRGAGGGVDFYATIIKFRLIDIPIKNPSVGNMLGGKIARNELINCRHIDELALTPGSLD
jgi:hypothetical protein